MKIKSNGYLTKDTLKKIQNNIKKKNKCQNQ